MARLEWSTSYSVFVAEMDDEHKDIFEALSELRDALARRAPRAETRKLTETLAARIENHCAHEERLMRAASYDSYRWHKQRHDGARRRVAVLAARIAQGEPDAGGALIEYLTSWLHDHTRIADMMLAAFLRNHRRGLCKVTFRAGTKPADACEWVDANGEKFDPAGTKRAL